MAEPIWLVVRISAARARASAGKIALKWESKEKKTTKARKGKAAEKAPARSRARAKAS